MNMTFKFSLRPAGSAGAAALAALLVGACAGAALEPDARDASWASTRWPGTSVAELQGGRSLFVARCSSCHALPEANVKTADEWARVIDEMAPRAHLAAEERDRVLRYLSAASERLSHGG